MVHELVLEKEVGWGDVKVHHLVTLLEQQLEILWEHELDLNLDCLKGVGLVVVMEH